MSEITYWAEYLEDKGKIVNQSIQSIKITIEEIKHHQKCLENMESAFIELISKGYTNEEIAKAKSTFNLNQK